MESQLVLSSPCYSSNVCLIRFHNSIKWISTFPDLLVGRPWPLILGTGIGLGAAGANCSSQLGCCGKGGQCAFKCRWLKGAQGQTEGGSAPTSSGATAPTPASAGTPPASKWFRLRDSRCDGLLLSLVVPPLSHIVRSLSSSFLVLIICYAHRYYTIWLCVYLAKLT